jgi:WD40 repeat protein
MCWDVAASSGSSGSGSSSDGGGRSSWCAKRAHEGHVTALAWQLPAHEGAAAAPAESSSSLALSGGQDGFLRAWDSRQGGSRCVAQQALHAGPRGKGALGGIAPVTLPSGRSLVVTAGADKALTVCDPVAGFRRLHASTPLTDFPYCLAAVGGGLVACGCGDGSVHVVDVAAGRTLYALGAGRAAIRCLQAGPDWLVCSGDDGCATCYAF